METKIRLQVDGKEYIVDEVPEAKPTFDVTLYFDNAIAHPGEKINMRGIRTTLTPIEVFGVLQNDSDNYSAFLPGARKNCGLIVLERPRYAEVVPAPATDPD